MKKEEVPASAGSAKKRRNTRRQSPFLSERIIPAVSQTNIHEHTGSQIQVERQIVQQREFSALVIDSLAYPYVVIDANDFTVCRANAAAGLGDLPLGTPCYKLFYNRERPCPTAEIACPVREVRKRKTSCVFEHHHNDDSGNAVMYSEIHAHPVYDPRGELSQVVTCSIDKTDHRKRETRLREAASQYGGLFESLPIGVLLISFEGQVLQSNTAMCNLSQYTDAELGTMNVTELLAGWEKYEPILDRLKNNDGLVHDGEVKLLRKAGSPTDVRFTISRFTLDGSSVVLASAIDVTPLKKAEAELNRSLKALEQKNLVLKELVEQIETEKHMLKDAIGANVRELVLPMLEKLRLTQGPSQYLDMLEHRLNSIMDRSGIKIDQIRAVLSPREIEICTRIQSGLTSKEIAQLLGVSYQTVEKHRRNIRKKIGLSGKKMNLVSYLPNESTPKLYN